MNRTPPKNGRICADHFSEDQWEIYGKILKKHAAPFIFGVPKLTLFSSLQVAPDKNGKALWKPIQTGVILTTKSILDLQNLFLNEKKNLIFINFEIFARLFRERFQFKQDLKLLSVSQYLDMPFNNNTNYEYDEGAPLTGFLNYIRMNQDKKNYNDNETERNLILPSGWNKHQNELSLRKKKSFV
jgi:hypothetical protein